MIKIEEKLSNKLSNISFICTLMVVFIHCSNDGVDIFSRILHRYIPGAFLPMAVPCFFTISGFLLAGRFGETGWYRKALAKRVKTLIVPYVILNFLYWPIKWAVHSVAMKKFGSEAMTMIVSWRTPFDILGIPFFNGPAIGPLWYVASLMYFIVLSPLFCYLVMKSRLRAIVILIISILIFGSWRYICSIVDMPLGIRKFLYFGFSLWGLIFFMLGMVVRVWLKNLSFNTIMIVCGILGIVLALLLARYRLCDDNIYYIVPTILCLMGSMAIVPSKRWPTYLIENSFALFVLHVQFIYIFDALLKLFHCYHLSLTGWGMISEFVICVFVIILFINSFRKVCPKIVDICLGGR